MADFARPTFDQILARIQADFDAQIPDADPRLRRSVLDVLAYAEAGVANGLYGFDAFMALQMFVDTANSDFLSRHGVIWGVERLQAVQAKGPVVFTGTNGNVVPAGTQLQRSDLTIYITDSAVTIASGSATAQVTAQEPGEPGNTAAASKFTFVSPIAGIDSNATVDTGGLTGGLDIEADDAYLQRILLKIQQPPQGGAAVDYEIWAKAASAAVTNVWVYPIEGGPGTVTVRFMTYGATGDGIPASGVVDTVQAYIDSKKPVTAMVTVEAPTADTLNFTIALTIADGYILADVKDAVEANLEDMLRRDASPGGTIYKSRIIDNILSTPGVFNATVTAPSADVTSSSGHIPVMGTVTWT